MKIQISNQQQMLAFSKQLTYPPEQNHESDLLAFPYAPNDNSICHYKSESMQFEQVDCRRAI